MSELLISRILFTALLLGALVFVWTQPVSLMSWYEKYLPKTTQANPNQQRPGASMAVTGNDNIVAGRDVLIQVPQGVLAADLERQKKESDPNVKIELERKPGEITIRIRAEKHVSKLALDIPILGTIVSIHDNNSVADAVTRSKKVVGMNSGISANNVELLVEDIKPAKEISYKVIFRHLPRGVFVAGMDRYQFSYNWQFAGNVFGKEGWISLETGEPVSKPQIQIKGFHAEKRAVSPEEIKKLYEEGLKRRELE